MTNTEIDEMCEDEIIRAAAKLMQQRVDEGKIQPDDPMYIEFNYLLAALESLTAECSSLNEKTQRLEERNRKVALLLATMKNTGVLPEQLQ